MARPNTLIPPSSIPYIREEKLRREVSVLETKKGMILRNREKSRNFQKSIQVLEVEICYLQRELEIREKRRKAHTLFLKKRSDKRARRP